MMVVMIFVSRLGLVMVMSETFVIIIVGLILITILDPVFGMTRELSCGVVGVGIGIGMRGPLMMLGNALLLLFLEELLRAAAGALTGLL